MYCITPNLAIMKDRYKNPLNTPNLPSYYPLLLFLLPFIFPLFFTGMGGINMGMLTIL